MIVVEALNQNEGNGMMSTPVLEDCRETLKDFGKVSAERCNRESNIVAHELASWGRLNPPTVWVDDPPYLLFKVLVDYVTVI